MLTLEHRHISTRTLIYYYFQYIKHVTGCLWYCAIMIDQNTLYLSITSQVIAPQQKIIYWIDSLHGEWPLAINWMW